MTIRFLINIYIYIYIYIAREKSCDYLLIIYTKNITGAPKEDIVQNNLSIALLNVF